MNGLFASLLRPLFDTVKNLICLLLRRRQIRFLTLVLI